MSNVYRVEVKDQTVGYFSTIDKAITEARDFRYNGAIVVRSNEIKRDLRGSNNLYVRVCSGVYIEKLIIQ